MGLYIYIYIRVYIYKPSLYLVFRSWIPPIQILINTDKYLYLYEYDIELTYANNCKIKYQIDDFGSSSF